jgi:hypothetical protein
MSDKAMTHLPLVTEVVAIMSESTFAPTSFSGNLGIILGTSGDDELLLSLTPGAASTLKSTLETMLANAPTAGKGVGSH